MLSPLLRSRELAFLGIETRSYDSVSSEPVPGYVDTISLSEPFPYEVAAFDTPDRVVAVGYDVETLDDAEFTLDADEAYDLADGLDELANVEVDEEDGDEPVLIQTEEYAGRELALYYDPAGDVYDEGDSFIAISEPGEEASWDGFTVPVDCAHDFAGALRGMAGEIGPSDTPVEGTRSVDPVVEARHRELALLGIVEVRDFHPDQLRIPKGAKGGGQWRSIRTRIIALMRDLDGDANDVRVLNSFSKKQLLDVAHGEGLSVPDGIKPAPLKSIILAHYHRTGLHDRPDDTPDAPPVKAAKKAAPKRMTGAEKAAHSKAVVKSYVDGKSIQDIADETGVSASSIHTTLVNAGVQLRPRGSSAKSRATQAKKAAANAEAKMAAKRAGISFEDAKPGDSMEITLPDGSKRTGRIDGHRMDGLSVTWSDGEKEDVYPHDGYDVHISKGGRVAAAAKKAAAPKAVKASDPGARYFADDAVKRFEIGGETVEEIANNSDEGYSPAQVRRMLRERGVDLRNGRGSKSGRTPGGAADKVRVAKKAVPKVKREPAEIAASVNAAQSRDEVDAHLEGLTLPELKQVAKEMNIPLRRGSTTKERIRDDIAGMITSGLTFKSIMQDTEAYTTGADRVRQWEGVVDSRLDSAVADLATKSDNGWVSLADLREHPAFKDLPRAEQDAAIRRMALDPNRPDVMPVANLKSISPVFNGGDTKHFDAAIEIGGEQAHAIYVGDKAKAGSAGTGDRRKEAIDAGLTPGEVDRFVQSGMTMDAWRQARTSSTPIRPKPTPPNPTTPWGQNRDDPHFTWSEMHGRPANLDQVDRIYTAESRQQAREFLWTRDDQQLLDIADGGSVDVPDELLHRDRAAYIERVIDGIREPERKAGGAGPTTGKGFDRASTLARLQDFDNPPSREEAHAMLAGASKAELIAMARELNMPGASGRSVEDLREEIVEATAGRRIDSIATRGFKGKLPGAGDVRVSQLKEQAKQLDAEAEAIGMGVPDRRLANDALARRRRLRAEAKRLRERAAELGPGGAGPKVGT